MLWKSEKEIRNTLLPSRNAVLCVSTIAMQNTLLTRSHTHTCINRIDKIRSRISQKGRDIQSGSGDLVRHLISEGFLNGIYIDFF